MNTSLLPRQVGAGAARAISEEAPEVWKRSEDCASHAASEVPRGLTPKTPAPASWLGGSRLGECTGGWREEEWVEVRGCGGDQVRIENGPPNSHLFCLRPSPSERVLLLQLRWDVTSNSGMTAMMSFNIN